MKAQPILRSVLLLLGAGFLVANARLVLEHVRFLRRRRGALLTWPTPKPPYYGMALAIGVMMGLLVFYKIVVLREQAFGEALDPDKLERLGRYEVHLDRKLERMLAMLLRLKDLRQETVAG